MTTLLTDSERLDWLRLIRSENVGPISFFQLLRRYGTAAAALDALPCLPSAVVVPESSPSRPGATWSLSWPRYTPRERGWSRGASQTIRLACCPFPTRRRS